MLGVNDNKFERNKIKFELCYIKDNECEGDKIEFEFPVTFSFPSLPLSTPIRQLRIFPSGHKQVIRTILLRFSDTSYFFTV